MLREILNVKVINLGGMKPVGESVMHLAMMSLGRSRTLLMSQQGSATIT